MVMTKSQTFIRAKCTAAIAFAALALAPLANAGTYSIVDVEWYPANAPGTYSGGGYLHFGTGGTQNPLDVFYGLSASESAPWFTSGGMGPPVGHPNAAGVATMQGIFRWKVQWVGVAGEAAPLGINGNAEYKGGSTCTASAMSYGGQATAQDSINDPFFPIPDCHATGSPPGVPVNVTVNSPFNGVQNLTVGATFSHVAGTVNTSIGYFTDSVNDIAALTATGSLGPGGMGLMGVASCTATMDVIIRLTFVGGQRVQPDL